MGSPQPRSAALVIGVHLDDDAGGRWYAILEGYDGLGAPRRMLGRVRQTEELMATVREWLDSAVAGPSRLSGGV